MSKPLKKQVSNGRGGARPGAGGPRISPLGTQAWGVSLPRELVSEIQAACERLGISQSEFARAAVTRELQRLARQAARAAG